MRVTRWLGHPTATYMYSAEPAPTGVASATWGTADRSRETPLATLPREERQRT